MINTHIHTNKLAKLTQHHQGHGQSGKGGWSGEGRGRAGVGVPLAVIPSVGGAAETQVAGAQVGTSAPV